MVNGYYSAVRSVKLNHEVINVDPKTRVQVGSDLNVGMFQP